MRLPELKKKMVPLMTTMMRPHGDENNNLAPKQRCDRAADKMTLAIVTNMALFMSFRVILVIE